MDPVNFVGEMIAGNLMVRLFQQDNVAPFIDQIVNQVDEFLSPEYWRLLTEQPIDDAADLKQALLDLQAVVVERAGGGKAAALALDAAARHGFVAAAKAAREISQQRYVRLTKRVREHLANAGQSATVAWPEDIRASGDGPVILVELESMFVWATQLEEIVALCRPAVGDQVGFTVAPVRSGRVVGSFAVKVSSGIYPTEDLRASPELPLPLLDESLGDTFREGMGAVVATSAIVATLRPDGVHDAETRALEAVTGRAQNAQQSIATMVTERPCETLDEVQDCLLSLAGLVDGEIDARNRQAPRRDTVAASILTGLRGTPDGLFGQCMAVAALCAEHGVDPQESWKLLESALESVDVDTP
jgi:hypothetical protein